MRTVVLGAGAMGSLLAGRLALAGGDVILLGRASAHVEAVRRSGLRLVDLDGVARLVPLAVTTDAEAARGADLLVVLVKAWATAEALRPLRGVVDGRTAVLTLQNGLGQERAIRAALDPDGRGEPPVLVGVTTEAALREEAGTVRRTGPGATTLGALRAADAPFARRVAAILSAHGWPATAVAEIEPWRWRKLAVNAAINPLTALAGVPNGAIAEDRELARAAATLAAEVAAVATARGLDPGDVGAAVDDVARATAANRSSMLRDLETGGRTEIDAINGAVVSAGRELGIPTPANVVVAALVRARERAGGADRG